MSVSIDGKTTTGSAANMVQIFEFIANYQLADVNSDIQNRMTVAVANMLQVNSSQVFLSFSAVTLRALSQQESVLVHVALINFQGSTMAISSVITQENINYQMVAIGLKLVVLLTKSISTAPGIRHAMPNDEMQRETCMYVFIEYAILQQARFPVLLPFLHSLRPALGLIIFPLELLLGHPWEELFLFCLPYGLVSRRSVSNPIIARCVCRAGMFQSSNILPLWALSCNRKQRLHDQHPHQFQFVRPSQLLEFRFRYSVRSVLSSSTRKKARQLQAVSAALKALANISILLLLLPLTCSFSLNTLHATGNG
jgi:hypothetical protein